MANRHIIGSRSPATGFAQRGMWGRHLVSPFPVTPARALCRQQAVQARMGVSDPSVQDALDESLDAIRATEEPGVDADAT